MNYDNLTIEAFIARFGGWLMSNVRTDLEVTRCDSSGLIYEATVFPANDHIASGDVPDWYYIIAKEGFLTRTAAILSIEELYDFYLQDGWMDLTQIVTKELREFGFVDPPKRTVAAYRKLLEEKDLALFEDLVALRTKIANDKGIPPFVVFSNRVLYDLTLAKPRSVAEMRAIHGIGKKNSEIYGEAVVEVIARH